MAVEIKSKWRVPDAHAAQHILLDPWIRAFTQEEWRTKETTAFYYDTPGHELNRRRWELRLRHEGGQCVAALKTPWPAAPPGLIGRNEWQCPAGDIGTGVPRLVAVGAPEELRRLAAPAPLAELCQVVCRHEYGVLELPGGVVARLSLNAGELSADAKKEPYIEMEIELLFGDPAEVRSLAGHLEDKYVLVPELAGKYERALRLIRSRKN